MAILLVVCSTMYVTHQPRWSLALHLFRFGTDRAVLYVTYQPRWSLATRSFPLCD